VTKVLDTVLLLALPASGKSEVRKYLAQLPAGECRDDFHMGPTVQLDDFPYVHFMRRIDDELAALGKARIFYHSPDAGFTSTNDWGTLIQMMNDDYDDLRSRNVVQVQSAAQYYFERIDESAARTGIAHRLSPLGSDLLAALGDKLEMEAAELLREKNENIPDSLEGKTLVIEFARGGAQGSSLPLSAPFGYQYSVGQLSDAVLSRASVLYIWVTPEESRRKNTARTDPNDPGSILHHGVPMSVMLGDYGCDDMDWLQENARVNGTIPIDANGKSYDLPIGRFDNRVDKTSFIRNDSSEWSDDEVSAVHNGLKQGLDQIATLAL
jgi:hypothetical protein